MTKKDAWVRFAVGALADPKVTAFDAANAADSMLILMGKRWPEGRGEDEDPLVPKAEEGGKGDA